VRALVTGGAGFIGSNLVDFLIRKDAEVVVLDNLVTGKRENLHPSATFIEGDVTALSDARKAVTGCDIIFHLAACRAVLQSIDNPLISNETNVTGTLNMLIAARDEGAQRFILASSSSVYGGAEELPTPESAPLYPRSPYAVSKLAAEHYCRVFWEIYGLETVVLRYFNVYGPRQRPDSQYAAVIPLFIRCLLSQESPIIYGDGRQSRDFTYIEDTVQANFLAATTPTSDCAGEIFNIACGEVHTLRELLNTLGDILDITPTPHSTDQRPGDIMHSHADIGKSQSRLHYTPKISFRDGLTQTVNWHQEHGNLFSRK